MNKTERVKEIDYRTLRSRLNAIMDSYLKGMDHPDHVKECIQRLKKLPELKISDNPFNTEMLELRNLLAVAGKVLQEQLESIQNNEPILV